MTIGILGGGQLGYMLALAGYPLGLHFRFLDPSPEAPVGRVATRITAKFTDRGALKKFAQGLALVCPGGGGAVPGGTGAGAARACGSGGGTGPAEGKGAFSEAGHCDDGICGRRKSQRARFRSRANRLALGFKDLPYGLRRQGAMDSARRSRRQPGKR